MMKNTADIKIFIWEFPYAKNFLLHSAPKAKIIRPYVAKRISKKQKSSLLYIIKIKIKEMNSGYKKIKK